ncbi:agamous-like MADS-box protein AGL11 [Arachis stenosperma]|uniref:agamous-like MADS-box protein AGL11 n=1 Tax=Arachis stenosperma TaxID=217475 RepID=UPI0025AD88B9|nr:agamous-like MADS-box protein AGL11 [Arachis stenosperma]
MVANNNNDDNIPQIKRRVKLQLIDDMNSRKATFRKRRAGLLKKLEQLAILCDIQACIAIFGLAEAIYGGEMVIDVSYFGRHIHSETTRANGRTHKLCAETSCPVSIGDFNVAYTQVLPGFTCKLLQSFGSYSLKMKMFEGSKNEVTCIEFGFYIGFVTLFPPTIADIYIAE